LTSENTERLSIYFDPGEKFITREELKQRRIERGFLKKLTAVVDKIKEQVIVKPKKVLEVDVKVLSEREIT